MRNIFEVEFWKTFNYIYMMNMESDYVTVTMTMFQVSEDLRSGIFFFGMSNSLVNPIIYGVFHLWRPKRKYRHSDFRCR